MKRTLVSYDESSPSESEGEVTPLPNKRPKSSSASPQPPPLPVPPAPTGLKPQHKRKLPALAAHLAPSVPPDDPSNHQGRTRTTPHVDDQWAAYVYVPIALRGTALRASDASSSAQWALRDKGGTWTRGRAVALLCRCMRIRLGVVRSRGRWLYM